MATSAIRSSLWAATASPAPETPPLAGERRADVVVVGAGYTGLSAALHLALAGSDVVVLEAEQPGFGASGRNHGQVIPALGAHGPDDLVARLGPERGERMNAWIAGSAELVFELIREHEIDCDGLQVGWLMPIDSPAREALVRGRHDQWAARGAKVRMLDRDATREMVGSEVYYGAWLHERGGNIQPLSYARGLARAVIAAGARVHGASPATRLARRGGGWRVETPRGVVEADAVILATNAYSGRLYPGLEKNVVPFRLFLGATRPLGDNLRRTILPGRQSLSDSRAVLWPFRYDREGRLITGGDHVIPAFSRERAARAVAARIRRTFPQAGDVEIEYVWDGKVAMTMDRLPRYFEPAPGLFAGLGYNGRGIALATAMGKLLAARVHGLADDEMPIPRDRPKSLPFHDLAVPLARLALIPYRWRDFRAAATRDDRP